jgi:hypothetical protein
MFDKHPYDLFWVILLQKMGFFSQTKPENNKNIFFLAYGQKF